MVTQAENVLASDRRVGVTPGRQLSGGPGQDAVLLVPLSSAAEARRDRARCIGHANTTS